MDQGDGIGRGRPIRITELRRPLGYPHPDVTNTYPMYQGTICPADPPNGYVCDAAGMVHQLPGNPIVFTPANTERKISTLSPFAEEFFPRNFRPEPRILATDMPEDAISMPPLYPVQELRTFLNEITINPGKFESKVQKLTDTLNTMVDDDDTMQSIVNIIFDESVRLSNLRYNGARLCKTLCYELVPSPERHNFRSVLLTRCSHEVNHRKMLAQADDNGTFLRGFTMFMAELFSQLEVSTKKKIVNLGDGLPSLIKTILDYPSPDNLKCACQVLKLVGASLEDYERSTHEGTCPGMDSIVTNLKTLANGHEITRNIRDLINSVIKLRDSDWGRVSSHTENTLYESSPPLSDDPVMYGPDGKPMTADELMFLQSQYSNSNLLSEDDLDYYADDPAADELTDEISEAYELFLQEQAGQRH